MVDLDRPRDRDSHTLADYAELLCLLSADRICSRESIRDRIRDVGDVRIEDNELEDCFSQLEWRAMAYSEAYPFVVPEGRTLRAPDDLSNWQRLYVLLLLCANLPFIRSEILALTSVFERISLLAIKAIWPLKGVVRPFGKNLTDYTGQKWSRINQLAIDIGGRGACTEHTFRGRDTGDGGIDLMAALPLDDHERRNIPALLGQCACSRDQWVSKQTEISGDRLGNQIHASHPWMQALMIPQSFRDNLGKWAVEGDLGRTILFDRLRIVIPLGPDVDWATIQAPDYLQEFLIERLPLV
ncbi:hypothetical protein FNZ56_03925 [Pseudoluteimonas lycopersici]|uniref:Uncharacterized protein n=1 Tax=Pseudoluteimonas lycopersici TaxID=1324796 RepID=A0A516V3H7_9GAMM|nr:hypothetical protein [Lysobacter lycopersici]QDQ73079.1 hypothetical protein FNZ56_03925 [Lysobacter lycopersici]